MAVRRLAPLSVAAVLGLIIGLLANTAHWSTVGVYATTAVAVVLLTGVVMPRLMRQPHRRLPIENPGRQRYRNGRLSRERGPWNRSSQTIDAITLLKKDHKVIETLFEKFEKAGDDATKAKRQTVDEIITELSMHAAIEEQVFYPAVREAMPDVEDAVFKALEEHHVAEWTLAELIDMSPDHERFDAIVTVLIESVRHHVDEEEGELFPEVRKALGRKALREIGDAMEEGKKTAPTTPQPRMPDAPPGNLTSVPAKAAAKKARAAQKKAKG